MQATILFSGPGGSSQGLRASGFSTTGIELSSDAFHTASAAEHHTVQADVSDLDPRDFDCDLLQASPPCQEYSVAGLKTGRYTDYRNSLVWEPLRWIKAIKPRYVLLEQVPYVLTIWEAMAEELMDMGYHVSVSIMNALDFGVPQSRKRAILIAGPKQIKLPPPIAPVSMSEATGWDAQDLVGFPRKADSLGRAVEINGVQYRARDLKTASLPANTLTSKARSWSRFSQGERYRVSIEEASLLQSFPHNYAWQGSRTSQFLQLANAFSPKMVQLLTEGLLNG